MTSSTFAIAVMPSQPAPPMPVDGCKYQVRADSSDSYKCLTQQEWDQRQAQKVQGEKEFNDFLAANWWAILLWIVITVIAWKLIMAAIRGIRRAYLKHKHGDDWRWYE